MSTPTTETPAEPPQVTRQKYEEAKHELQALLARKKQVDTNLVCLFVGWLIDQVNQRVFFIDQLGERDIRL